MAARQWIVLAVIARGTDDGHIVLRGLRLHLITRAGLHHMTEDDITDEISQLETRIEALAEVAERCRKIVIASKVAVAGGFALLLVVMLGLFGSSQVTALGSIALVLGGIVSLGSNVSTLRQTEAAINAAEGLRSDLIGGIDLRVVDDAPMKLM